MAAVYQFDPDAAPDSDFVPGGLEHLVAGNRGRLLDQRRTPIAITRVAIERGEFEVEIGAFEDAGARWQLPLGEVAGFQFAPDAARADAPDIAAMEGAVAQFDQPLTIEADPAAREATLARIAAEREAVCDWLRERIPPDTIDVSACVAGRRGDPRLFAAVDDFLAERDLIDLDRAFAAAFVSNPGAGELVKGHAIVLAELGLCAYRGKIVRDPELFTGERAKEQRARHLIARLTFSSALWSLLGQSHATLYRGAAADGPLGRRSPTSFVSATFSRDVAEDHFAGGPTTQTAVLWRQAVPAERLVMTFLETAALNDRYAEAEAVLVADPGNPAF